ncbi:MAG: Lrp/AsnC family transcriptional regulator [Thaumarchaeota archaeon]|nr:Lrp/AsnC family transcriptional regulator [Nitrososphaerota archaeon]MCZ6725213.1 Lrp/AsnC family transcriptional regulator [Nitrososphaerota archaeon]
MADIQLDDSDKKIVSVLKENSRQSFVEIGKEVGLSEAAVRRRVKRLTDSGYLKRFTVELDQSTGAKALTFIAVSPTVPIPEVSKSLKKLDGVEGIYEITGEYDILSNISGQNITEVNRCIDEIRRINGVSNTNTIIILKSIS